MKNSSEQIEEQIGLKGKEFLKPGFVYAPYVPLYISSSFSFKKFFDKPEPEPEIDEDEMTFESKIDHLMRKMGY